MQNAEESAGLAGPVLRGSHCIRTGPGGSCGTRGGCCWFLAEMSSALCREPQVELSSLFHGVLGSELAVLATELCVPAEVTRECSQAEGRCPTL